MNSSIKELFKKWRQRCLLRELSTTGTIEKTAGEKKVSPVTEEPIHETAVKSQKTSEKTSTPPVKKESTVKKPSTEKTESQEKKTTTRKVEPTKKSQGAKTSPQKKSLTKKKASTQRKTGVKKEIEKNV